MAACSVAVMTEPECLGPCEPGTSVSLEAVIWHESNSGILVVNVTWKGRKYVGTLLDSTVHKWAPPSFRSDSPSKENETASPQKRKTRRGRGGKKPVVQPCIPRTWGGDFKPQKSPFAEPPCELKPPEKRSRCDIECPEQKCNKKFRCQNALEYHRIHAHVQNEIELMSPTKVRANKPTRGIQTQTCSEELQSKPAQGGVSKSAAANSDKHSVERTDAKSDNQQTRGSTATDAKGVSETDETAHNHAAISTSVTTKPNVITSSSTSMQSISNNQSHVQVKAVTAQAHQRKGSIVSGTVRPMMGTSGSSSSKIDHTSKRGGAPVAVLRPLIPQHVSQFSTDKTIASITTPTHTLSISSSQPQYRAMQTGANVAIGSSASSAVVKTTSVSGVSSMARTPFKPGGKHSSDNTRMHNQSNSKTNGVDGADNQKTPSSGLVLAHRRDSGKSRGSRSNSMNNSPNYSDISDASDGDMDTTNQGGELVINNSDGPERNEPRGEMQSAEERLYCNEELPSPSNTPGVKETESRPSPVKNIPTSAAQPQPQQRAAPNSPAAPNTTKKPGGSANEIRHAVPLHAVPPPPAAAQHIMYPYFPFMPPNQQLSPASMPAGAPMYAAPHPYFMTYQGMPFMQPGHPPPPGVPGAPPGAPHPPMGAPGPPAFVAVSAPSDPTAANPNKSTSN